jgi:hypothetical protein
VPREEVPGILDRVRLILDRETRMKKALAAGQTTPDILGLRAKLPK